MSLTVDGVPVLELVGLLQYTGVTGIGITGGLDGMRYWLPCAKKPRSMYSHPIPQCSSTTRGYREVVKV